MMSEMEMRATIRVLKQRISESNKELIEGPSPSIAELAREKEKQLRWKVEIETLNRVLGDKTDDGTAH